METNTGSTQRPLVETQVNGSVPEHTPNEQPPSRKVQYNEIQCARYGCGHVGVLHCNTCGLVTYCSELCKLCHEVWHQRECSSEYSKSDWTPGYVREGRKVVPFVLPERAQYLWGNTPAIDILNLSNNEGSETTKDLDLCFAASGDLRTIMFTIIKVPGTYRGKIKILINDQNELVVCRNLLLLLIIQSSSQQDAANAILHLWYSAALDEKTMSVMESVNETICSMMDEVTSTDGLSGDEHTLRTGNVTTWFPAKVWKTLFSIVSPFLARRGLGGDAIILEERLSEHNAAPRADARHSRYCCMEPYARVSEHRYSQTGVLLPFGYSAHGFIYHNPYGRSAVYRNPVLTTNRFLFEASNAHGSTKSWIPTPYDDPTRGWKESDLRSAAKQNNLPPNDRYGMLYFLMLDVIARFHTTCKSSKLSLFMTQADATWLPRMLAYYNEQMPSFPSMFDRIDINNLLDYHHGGPENVMYTFEMLKPLSTNRNARLLGYFMKYLKTLDARSIQCPQDNSVLTYRTKREIDRIRPTYYPHIWAVAGKMGSKTLYSRRIFNVLWSQRQYANCLPVLLNPVLAKIKTYIGARLGRECTSDEVLKLTENTIIDMFPEYYQVVEDLNEAKRRFSEKMDGSFYGESVYAEFGFA